MNTFVALIIIANIALIVFVVAYISKTMKNEKGKDKNFKGDVELVHDNGLLQDDLGNFADEVLSKIDHRMAQLRKLIKEADDRINTLEAMSSNVRIEARANQPPQPRPRVQLRNGLLANKFKAVGGFSHGLLQEEI